MLQKMKNKPTNQPANKETGTISVISKTLYCVKKGLDMI